MTGEEGENKIFYVRYSELRNIVRMTQDRSQKWSYRPLNYVIFFN